MITADSQKAGKRKELLDRICLYLRCLCLNWNGILFEFEISCFKTVSWDGPHLVFWNSCFRTWRWSKVDIFYWHHQHAAGMRCISPFKIFNECFREFGFSWLLFASGMLLKWSQWKETDCTALYWTDQSQVWNHHSKRLFWLCIIFSQIFWGICFLKTWLGQNKELKIPGDQHNNKRISKTEEISLTSF